jgi:hypothetical protein
MRSPLIGISAAAMYLLAVSSGSAAPLGNYTPIPAPPPVALVAACLTNGNYCSSDAECCSHKCLANKMSVMRCASKLQRY